MKKNNKVINNKNNQSEISYINKLPLFKLNWFIYYVSAT